jgi:hypothetical protein
MGHSPSVEFGVQRRGEGVQQEMCAVLCELRAQVVDKLARG